MSLHRLPEVQSNVDRAVVTCSVWLHAAYIGLVAVAAGLIRLLVFDASWFSALVLALCGGVLAAACWRRAWTVLDQAESASSVATNAPEKSAPRFSSMSAGRGRVVAFSHGPLRLNRRRANHRHRSGSR